MTNEPSILFLLLFLLVGKFLYAFYLDAGLFELVLFSSLFLGLLVSGGLLYLEFFGAKGRERKKRRKELENIPNELLIEEKERKIYLGFEKDLKANIYLPDNIRTRHSHILGSTGAGKTESVILNFLKQDIHRGLGSIILDAKGDHSFIDFLKDSVPKEKLKIFDLSSSDSATYNPLSAGNVNESAQRLFSSLTWSEEYYKSKAFSVLQRLFNAHHRIKKKNPSLADLNKYLSSFDEFLSAVLSDDYEIDTAKSDFSQISGLRDQIQSLCVGHLKGILSPEEEAGIDLKEAHKGSVLYFRLQSLLSPKIVSTLGKLLIGELNFLAGTAHLSGKKQGTILPVYFDEFSSFVCIEFTDLISKARSAGFALHFAHQSIGDLKNINEGFLSSIMDNSAIKVVMRINDPETAEYFSKTFGTSLYQKITQRVENSIDEDKSKMVGEGTQREAHQFRASPDLLKRLPTGMGSVLIAHGIDAPDGASNVFKIQFPRLKFPVPSCETATL